MIQSYQELISYKEDEWQDFLERICLIEIFMPVLTAYTDKDTLKCVIRYIVYTYSKQSDKVQLGVETLKNKEQIFEFVMVKPEKKLYNDLVLLESSAVIESVHKWLDYQDSGVWKQLCVLKDLKVEMQQAANSAIKKASGEIDYDQKMKNAEYATKISGMIKELEAELIQNDKTMKDVVKEVRSNKKTNNVGPETFSR